MDEFLEGLIFPISLLVGFAWKQAFVSGFNLITTVEHIAPVPLESLMLAGALVLVVVPAWRLHILPSVVIHAEASTKHKQERNAEVHKGSKKEKLLPIKEMSKPMKEMSKDEKIEQYMEEFNPPGFGKVEHGQVQPRSGGATLPVA